MVRTISKTIKEYKLANGEKRYLFQIRTGRHSTTRRRGFLSMEEAEIAYANLRNDILEGKFKEKAGMLTYSQIYDKWLIRYRETVKETTYSKTKEMFKLHIIPFFGKSRIDSITVAECQEALNNWIANLAAFKKPFNYSNKIFEEALRLDYIDKNPMDKLVLPKQSKLMEKNKRNHNNNNFYTIEEQEIFLKYAKEHSGLKKYVFFRLLAYTGLRREEILALKWKDIQDDHILIDKALVYTKEKGQFIQSTKNNDARNLILDHKTLELLNEWQKYQRTKIKVTNQAEQLIFPNNKNSYYALGRPRKWQQVINEKIELDHHVSIHGWRHTHGTLLIDNNPNISPKDLQKRLGHRDLATTMNVYMHATNKSDGKILKALDNLDNKNSKNNEKI